MSHNNGVNENIKKIKTFVRITEDPTIVQLSFTNFL